MDVQSFIDQHTENHHRLREGAAFPLHFAIPPHRSVNFQGVLLGIHQAVLEGGPGAPTLHYLLSSYASVEGGYVVSQVALDSERLNLAWHVWECADFGSMHELLRRILAGMVEVEDLEWRVPERMWDFFSVLGRWNRPVFDLARLSTAVALVPESGSDRAFHVPA